MTLFSISRRTLYLLATLALASLILLTLACGGDDDDDGGDDGGEETPTATEDGGGAVTADVSMGDNFFDPTDITVSAGGTLTVNITNDGTAIHNMRIAGTDNTYDNDDDAVSDPDIVNGGETATLEWTAPDEAGEIDFRCDFHPTEMIGTITVE